jgi:hypothetical protein
MPDGAMLGPNECWFTSASEHSRFAAQPKANPRLIDGRSVLHSSKNGKQRNPPKTTKKAVSSKTAAVDESSLSG